MADFRYLRNLDYSALYPPLGLQVKQKSDHSLIKRHFWQNFSVGRQRMVFPCVLRSGMSHDRREKVDEKQDQIAFYDRFKNAINPQLSLDEILADNNDGVFIGNILEFKSAINDVNSPLFQSIKYLSARRLKGKPVPANIITVDLSRELARVYKSSQYLPMIETVYVGPASKGNSGFVGGEPEAVLHYGTSDADARKLIQYLKSDDWTKINIDENYIVGWAEEFYRHNPEARKEDFIGDQDGEYKKKGEIRNPKFFKDYIEPYTKPTNRKYEYLMDRLNDNIQKKNLGAFYTPQAYVKKAQELLLEAIDRIPVNENGEKKYVVIDRCAGTGNLEEGLSDEILAHCILSTVEYYEYKVLFEKFGSRILGIIPPTEKPDTYDFGRARRGCLKREIHSRLDQSQSAERAKRENGRNTDRTLCMRS